MLRGLIAILVCRLMWCCSRHVCALVFAQCPRKLTNISGLVVHLERVHKTKLTNVPNAKPDRDRLDLEITGMEGIPEEAQRAHEARLAGETPAEKRQKTGADDDDDEDGAVNSATAASAASPAAPMVPTSFPQGAAVPGQFAGYPPQPQFPFQHQAPHGMHAPPGFRPPFPGQGMLPPSLPFGARPPFPGQGPPPYGGMPPGPPGPYGMPSGTKDVDYYCCSLLFVSFLVFIFFSCNA